MISEWWQPVAAAASVVLATVAAYQAGRAAKSAEAAAGKAAKEASDELYERLRTNDFAHVGKDIRRLDAKIDSTKHDIRASEARLLEAISGVRDLVTGLREAQP